MAPIVSLGFFIIGSIGCAIGMAQRKSGSGIPISIFGGALIIYSAIIGIGGN